MELLSIDILSREFPIFFESLGFENDLEVLLVVTIMMENELEEQ